MNRVKEHTMPSGGGDMIADTPGFASPPPPPNDGSIGGGVIVGVNVFDLRLFIFLTQTCFVLFCFYNQKKTKMHNTLCVLNLDVAILF